MAALLLEKVMVKENTRGVELHGPFGFSEGANVALEQTHQAMWICGELTSDGGCGDDDHGKRAKSDVSSRSLPFR